MSKYLTVPNIEYNRVVRMENNSSSVSALEYDAV